MTDISLLFNVLFAALLISMATSMFMTRPSHIKLTPAQQFRRQALDAYTTTVTTAIMLALTIVVVVVGSLWMSVAAVILLVLWVVRSVVAWRKRNETVQAINSAQTALDKLDAEAKAGEDNK